MSWGPGGQDETAALRLGVSSEGGGPCPSQSTMIVDWLGLTLVKLPMSRPELMCFSSLQLKTHVQHLDCIMTPVAHPNLTIRS